METTMTENREVSAAGIKMDETQGLTFPRIDCKNIDVFYGDKQAIFDISLPVPDRSVTALIGPFRLRQVNPSCGAWNRDE